VLVDPDGQPVIAGFSFSELSATRRQESAQWAWVLVAIGFSALTYPASAAGLLGGVAARVPFWPAVLTQGASSYVNRVSPANVGGMALNARFLQKAGVEPTAGVAAVGGQLPRRSPGPPDAPGDLLHLGGPRRRGPGVQAARRAARCWPSWRPWPRSSAS